MWWDVIFMMTLVTRSGHGRGDCFDLLHVIYTHDNMDMTWPPPVPHFI